MAGVNVNDLLDFQATTIAQYPDNKFRNMLNERSYIFGKWLKGLKPKKPSGTKAVFAAMIKGDSSETGDAADGGAGRYAPYESLGATASEYMVQGEIPWCYYQTYWVVSSQEAELNSGAEQVIDLAKAKLEGCMTTFANILEADFWSTSSYAYESASKPMVLGPEYWITDDGYHVNDTGGTNGTEVGGINPANTDYNDRSGTGRWLNQYIQQTVTNKVLDSMDRMFVNTKFQAPPDVTMNTKPMYDKFKICVDETTLYMYKDLQRKLRDNVGVDLSTGKPIFNNITLEYASLMTARTDSTYQQFWLNTDSWKAWVAPSNNFRRTKVFTPDNMDARMQRIYLWVALGCIDRRLNGKIFGYDGDVT